MSSLILNLKHVEEGLEKLLNQFENSPRMQNFLTVFLEEVQELETALCTISELVWLETAEGKQLDVLGLILNTKRDGFNDDLYRQLLRSKIIQYKSNGSRLDIEKVLDVLMGDDYELSWEDDFPAGFIVNFEEEGGEFSQRVVVNAIQNTKSAGVRFILNLIGFDPDLAFTFSSSSLVGVGGDINPDQGFGGLEDDMGEFVPSDETGGMLISSIDID